jgi:hypothetical protein
MAQEPQGEPAVGERGRAEVAREPEYPPNIGDRDFAWGAGFLAACAIVAIILAIVA